MSLPTNLAGSALLTDLYQLTMLQGYHEAGMEEIAVFEFFVRKLRPGRGFLMAAGLEPGTRTPTLPFRTSRGDKPGLARSRMVSGPGQCARINA